MSEQRDYAAIALQYAIDVVFGTISACKWVVAACQRQLSDLSREATPAFPFRYDPARGAKVCRLIELLPHIKGKWKTTTIRLEPWQIFIVMTVFSWVWATQAHADVELQVRDGFRRFRTVYIEVPRKNAKSTLTAGVGLYMVAPDGEQGAECYSAATTRDQARIVSSVALAMARRTPAYREYFGVEVNAHNLTVPDLEAIFKALSADDDSLDGLNPHFSSVDELHAHKTRGVWDVLETATGARDQSLLWAITTAGSNRAGICYEVRTYVTQILTAALKRATDVCDRRGYKVDGPAADDETVFGIVYTIDGPGAWSGVHALQQIAATCTCTTEASLDLQVTNQVTNAEDALARAYEAHADACAVRRLAVTGDTLSDRGDDWTDPAVWAKANPNLGVSVKRDDLERKCRKAQQLPSALPNFLTKHLNVWINADRAWMDMRRWDACADPALRIEDFAGEECIVSLDMASNIDIAAQVAVFRRSIEEPNAKTEELEPRTHYYAFGRFYVPEEVVEESDNSQYAGWESDGLLIATPGDIIDQNEIQDDLRAMRDVHQIREVAYDPFQATKFVTELAAEGFTMVEMGATVRNFSAPMKTIEALVRAKRLHHTGDPVFAWMVSNIVAHVDKKDNVFPNKQTAKNKIDGGVALIMNIGRWEGAEAPKGPSIYETEEVEFL